MWATRLRYAGLGILLLGVTVGLLVAWRVSHVLFGIIAGFIVLVVTVLFLARDGWRQTSPESLASRGLRPDTGLNVLDPGLRREFAPIIPAAISRRISGNPTRRPAARLAASSAAGTKPARSGRTRRRNETLQPGATVTLADERRAAHIDDLFIELDLELVGLARARREFVALSGRPGQCRRGRW